MIAADFAADAEGARLLHAVESWVEGEADADFDALALEIFAWQYQRLPIYRRFCDARHARPGQIADWTGIPMVPITAFRHQVFAAAPAKVIFRSSGTTGGPGERSVHHHAFPELYRRVIGRLFAPACLPAGAARRRPLLSLIPSPSQAPDSSLSFMVDEVFCRHGSGSSLIAFGSDGVDVARADSFCTAAVARGEAVTVLATSFALAAFFERSSGRWRLPAGSTLFETGGFKGRRRELAHPALAATTEERLGLNRNAQIREYGMTELTKPLLYRGLTRLGPRPFSPAALAAGPRPRPGNSGRLADGRSGHGWPSSISPTSARWLTSSPRTSANSRIPTIFVWPAARPGPPCAAVPWSPKSSSAPDRVVGFGPAPLPRAQPTGLLALFGASIHPFPTGQFHGCRCPRSR